MLDKVTLKLKMWLFSLEEYDFIHVCGCTLRMGDTVVKNSVKYTIAKKHIIYPQSELFYHTQST